MATNAMVDAAAATVPAPFGPLTRVTNMNTLPTPNDDFNIEFNTAVTGIKVFMSYNELIKPNVRNRILNQLGINADVERLKSWIGTMNTAAVAMTLPHDYNDWKTLFNNHLANRRNPYRGRL